MTKLSIGALLFTVFLAACDTADVPQDNASSVAMTVKVPSHLRNLSQNELTATISLNDEPGIEYAQGANDWSIPLMLIPDQLYSIDIAWHFSGVLVMEEYGEFFTDPDDFTINLQLDFLTTGFPRFDDDCDGVPNIAEADPQAEHPSSQSYCNPTGSTQSLDDNYNPVWVNHEFSIGTERVTSYRQPIKVQAYPTNVSTGYAAWLYGEDVETNRHSAYIQFAYIAAEDNEPAKKVAIVSASDATYSELTEIEGTTCKDTESELGFVGFQCTVPFEWKDEHWYEFKFEESTIGHWQTTILDSETNETLPLLVMEAFINWDFSVITVAFEYLLTASDCSQIFAPRTIQYASGTVNNTTQTTSRNTVRSACVKVNDQWHISRRNTDDNAHYSTTLGQL